MFFRREDFQYKERGRESRQRAEIPSSIIDDKNSGNIRDRTGNASKTQKGVSELINSDDFKEWFGDWQNDPQNASKVVDEDGKPLVVYHQTAADFTVFDTESKGADKVQHQNRHTC